MEPHRLRFRLWVAARLDGGRRDLDLDILLQAVEFLDGCHAPIDQESPSAWKWVSGSLFFELSAGPICPLVIGHRMGVEA